jgi:hypothetical protein
MWLISLPAWGERYVDSLLKYTLPSILACDRPKMPLHVIVHTDEVERVRKAFPTIDVRDVLPDPHGKISYMSMSVCHRDVLESARDGDYVTLMCADVVFSRDALVAAERRLRAGAKVVVCTGTRTIGPLFGNPPPFPWPAARLLEWAWLHRHPIIQQSSIPGGQSPVPSQLYFDTKNGVVARLFTPCLFALVKDRDLTFTGTIDRDLIECFDNSEIYVVTRRDELAVVEISPIEKSFGFLSEPLSPEFVATWARDVNLRQMNYWMLGHPIEITGPGDGSDAEFVAEVNAIAKALPPRPIPQPAVPSWINPPHMTGPIVLG